MGIFITMTNRQFLRLFLSLVPIAILCTPLISCGQRSDHALAASAASSSASLGEKIINEKATTLETRFNPPVGFERRPVDKRSFGGYLRNLPLKPAGTQVRYYNGAVKPNDVHQAVVDMEISHKDLQQCADAVMRLRGEYLYAIKAYERISFHLTNGFNMSYTEWMKGNRVVVNGNKTYWQKKTDPSNTYQDFRKYMDFVFTYAGTLSLSKELRRQNIKAISTGDVFIVGGSPGHAVIVVDVAEGLSGKVFMLAQSYMPAQEIHILKNLNNADISPWYNAVEGALYTPEWTFNTSELMTWP
jgi:hypothetical protein